MRNPGGSAMWSGGDGRTIERDTFTCCHCNSVVFVTPGKDPTADNGFCIKCMRPTCRACTELGTCTPWEKRMEAAERAITRALERDRAVRAMIGGR